MRMPVCETIYVVEWKEEFDWEPTLETAYTRADIKKKERRLREAYNGKRRAFRVRPYSRMRG